MESSEPTSKTDATAPRPWLSAETNIGPSPPAQVWSSSHRLTVSYPFVKRDFHRRILRHMRQNFRRSAPGFALLSFLFGGIPYFILLSISRGHTHSSVPAPVWRMTYISWAVTAVIMPLFTFLLSYGLAAFVTQITAWTAKHKRFIVTLSPQGIEQRFDFARTLRWSNVRKIEAREDGLMISGTGWMNRYISIPGAAFANPDAATRFSEAAHILWKSHGDMRLIPEETHDAFAPKEAAP